MLMQIAEPGESAIKEACKQRVVGIDLGTANSLVASVTDGSPQVIGDVAASRRASAEMGMPLLANAKTGTIT